MSYTLAFADPSQVSLYSVTAEQLELVRAVAATNEEGPPTFSPDGKQVAYTAAPLGKESLLLLTVDGGPPALDVSGDTQPNWSTAGELVCVADGGTVLESVDPSTSGRAGVAAAAAAQPAWDPADSAEFAYLSAQALRVQGDPLQGSSTSIAVASQVVGFSWSPTGDDLAFISSQSGGCELDISSVSSGSASTPVTVATGLSCTSPVDLLAWSPDGTSIAFSHGDSLYLVPSNSTGLDVNALLPAVSLAFPLLQVGWTPDSLWAVFTAEPSVNVVELGMISASGDGGPSFPTLDGGASPNVGLNGFAVSPE